MALNLYKLTAPAKSPMWGTYDSAVVAAHNEDGARETHPNRQVYWNRQYPRWQHFSPLQGYRAYEDDDWPSPSEVSVTLIGTAAPGIEAGVIVASYNPE